MRSGLLISDSERDKGLKRTLPAVRERGLACGLELCPPETALQMLIQEKIKLGEWWNILSPPVMAEERTKLSEGTSGQCLPTGEYNYRMFGVGMHGSGEAVLYASAPEGHHYKELGNFDSEAVVFMRSPDKKVSLPEWKD